MTWIIGYLIIGLVFVAAMAYYGGLDMEGDFIASVLASLFLWPFVGLIAGAGRLSEFGEQRRARAEALRLEGARQLAEVDALLARR